jgi:hypothetical protein
MPAGLLGLELAQQFVVAGRALRVARRGSRASRSRAGHNCAQVADLGKNTLELGGDASIVELVGADRWNGILPQTLLDGTGVTPLLGLPRQDNAGTAK